MLVVKSTVIKLVEVNTKYGSNLNETNQMEQLAE